MPREIVMEKDLLRLTPQAMNALFSYLINDSQIVTWIADYKFSYQIYLSESFKTLFGWSRDSMYNDLSLWRHFLIPDDKKRAETELLENYKDNLPFKLMYYRCHNPQGKILYAEDHHFPLEDQEGNVIVHGGYVNLLTPEQWHEKKQHQCKQQNQSKGLFFYETILREFKLKKSLNKEKPHCDKIDYSILFKNQRISLTHREAQTLYYLLQGYSTKLIAKQLNRSPRTIDIHINHIREKTKTRSRLELLSQIKNPAEVRTWKF